MSAEYVYDKIDEVGIYRWQAAELLKLSEKELSVLILSELKKQKS